ncbi:MAG: hypothetical protein ACXWP4_13835 [Polyangiales bacterium]
MHRARFLVAFALLANGCGGAPPAPPSTPVAAKPPPPPQQDDKSGFAQRDFTPYRSDRFGITVPLPERAAWVIADRDDQNGGWMVATHAATATVLKLRRFDETILAGRHECEMRARFQGVLPKPEAVEEGRFQMLADEPLRRPVGWDGHRWIGFESAPGGRLVGHVVLASGKAHSCLVVSLVTEVKSDGDTEALADRLELLSSRTVASITADHAKEPDMIPVEPPKGGGLPKGP